MFYFRLRFISKCCFLSFHVFYIFISVFISMNSSYNLWVMPVISYFLFLLEV